jgi:hypothetical protein
MERKSPLISEEDIFESLVLNNSQEDQVKRYQDAQRNSSMARGEKEEELS